MAHPRYYSPRIDRGLITRLYHAAKAQRIPMTVLANRLVEQGLARQEEFGSPPEGLVLREEPNAGR